MLWSTGSRLFSRAESCSPVIGVEMQNQPVWSAQCVRFLIHALARAINRRDIGQLMPARSSLSPQIPSRSGQCCVLLFGALEVSKLKSLASLSSNRFNIPVQFEDVEVLSLDPKNRSPGSR